MKNPKFEIRNPKEGNGRSHGSEWEETGIQFLRAAGAKYFGF
jgi:hypothetical protein